jgi:hypothetical protein
MNKVNKLLLTGGICLSMISCGVEKSNDKIEFDKNEVIEMKNTIEDILEWQQQDMENGHTNMGSHEEGWGSNYWLTEMRDELYNKLQ